MGFLVAIAVIATHLIRCRPRVRCSQQPGCDAVMATDTVGAMAQVAIDVEQDVAHALVGKGALLPGARGRQCV